MAPIVHGLEAKYNNRINFVYLDVDDPANNEFKAALGYLYQPDFFLLDANGNLLNRWTGPVDEITFEEAFQTALAP